MSYTIKVVVQKHTITSFAYDYNWWGIAHTREDGIMIVPIDFLRD